MTETKFTPGPWFLDAGFESSKPGDFDEYWQVHDGADAIACSANCYAGNREANAKLISAAPDLYHALKQAASHIQSIIEGKEWGAIEEVLDDCNISLAKARGEL